MDASESDLEEWGNQIRYRIESLQDHLVAGKTDVTSKKIVVKLEGPCMPNLSLVDLPGLRENDPYGCPGIKDKIEEMVTKQIQNANSVILAVSPGIVEYALWKGISLARKTDPMMERTVGVVTKVDLLYQEPCPAAYDELKGMLRPRIKKQSESQAVTYYAAYNPKDGDEVPPDMRARIAADFGDEKVGNAALSSFLQEKLNHLAAELPKQKEEIVRKKEQLREQLAEPEPEPEPGPGPELELELVEPHKWVDGQHYDPERLAAQRARVKVDGYGEGVVQAFNKATFCAIFWACLPALHFNCVLCWLALRAATLPARCW
eukprot:COSAG01_NODE_12288_length_1765_cov_11.675429_2_plen_319_part_00